MTAASPIDLTLDDDDIDHPALEADASDNPALEVDASDNPALEVDASDNPALEVDASDNPALEADASDHLPIEQNAAYRIAWICKLPTELAAAKAFLDEHHGEPLLTRGGNIYVLGRVGGHNVVIVRLPPRGVSTGTAVEWMLDRFRHVRFGLMVGIGGGVPTLGIPSVFLHRAVDLQLGDVVVSDPDHVSGGVIRYRSSRKRGEKEYAGALNRPPQVISDAVLSVRVAHTLAPLLGGKKKFHQYLEDIAGYPHESEGYSYPGSENDTLFKFDYDHVSASDEGCHSCDRGKVVATRPNVKGQPRVYRGLVASSSSKKMRLNGRSREKLRQDLGVVCVEDVTADLMDEFPCVVIRGICDYADTHKTTRWQPYAAATAAAFAKELLMTMKLSVVETTPRALTALAFPRRPGRMQIVRPRPEVGACTALYRASESEDADRVERVAYYVRHMTPKEVGQPSTEGKTALHVSRGTMGVVEPILSKMPPQAVGQVSSEGLTALESSIMEGWPSDVMLKIMSQMLPKDINRIGIGGRTALHRAVEMGCADAVESLVGFLSLECIWARTTGLKAQTALHMAVDRKNERMVRVIAGFKDDAEFGTRDSQKRTALHIAVQKGQTEETEEIVKILLEEMGETGISSVDRKGQTALDMAEANGDQLLAGLIRQRLTYIGARGYTKRLGQPLDLEERKKKILKAFK